MTSMAPLATSRTAASSPGPAVRATGLVKRFGRDVGVLGVDLTIARHEVFGLVGPNGAGKTTALSMLCGLSTPDEGVLHVDGRIALCPDTPEFEPWLTAAEVLRQSHALAHPRSRPEEGWLRAVMADTGVGAFADRRCGGLSRGMTQRLGIAAALVINPDVLVLDEPTSALDVAGRADVLALIRQLGEERAVVISSHALTDVQRTSDTIAVMDRGRLLFTGSPRQLIDEHLRPTWRVTLAEEASLVAAGMSGRAWVRRVRVRSAREFEVEAGSMVLGETRLVPALAELGARVVALTPVDADLESAFLTLTGRFSAAGPR